MPLINPLRPFSFSDNGYQLVPYEPGEPVEVSEECARVAVTEGWASPVEHKADCAAPENKDAAPKRRTKAAA